MVLGRDLAGAAAGRDIGRAQPSDQEPRDGLDRGVVQDERGIDRTPEPVLQIRRYGHCRQRVEPVSAQRLIDLDRLRGNAERLRYERDEPPLHRVERERRRRDHPDRYTTSRVPVRYLSRQAKRCTLPLDVLGMLPAVTSTAEATSRSCSSITARRMASVISLPSR